MTRSKLRRSNLPVYLFLLPAMILLLVFIVPAMNAIRLGFTDEMLIGEGYLNPEYVGFENFGFMFTDPNFYNSLRVTALFLVFSAWIGQFLIGLIAASVLRERSVRLRWLPNAAIILPMAVPQAAAAFMWASMLVPNETGTVNLIASLFGVAPRNWTMTLPVTSIIIVNIWKGMGFAFILFAAGLEAIGSDVREAATVDGATGLKMFLFITLPILAPTILLFLLLTTVGTLGSFGLVFFITAGGPGRATELISIYIYQESFAYYQLGYGAAVGVIMLILSIGLGILYLKILRVEI
jgi:multiple sugar transport system permease protein